MVDKKFKDFDAAIAEAAEEKITFKLAGKTFELPGQLPARVVLTQMRFMDADGEMAANTLPEWLESLVGKSNLDEMLDEGATWPQLDELLQFLLEEYGLAGDQEIEAETEGDADPKA
jgi:bifunctional pyridoxal-dependent enzyme with beta-cystathionase and maltose regulon repressor activities